MKIAKLNNTQTLCFKNKKTNNKGNCHNNIINYVKNHSKEDTSDIFQTQNTTSSKLDLSKDKYIEKAIKAYKKHGIDAKFNEDGTIRLNRFYNCNFNQKDVNEKHFFQYVTSILRDANFSGTEITDLPRLESVGGSLIVYSSKIKSAINLKSIGNNSDLRSAELKELPKLESVGINTIGLENIYTPKLKNNKH